MHQFVSIIFEYHLVGDAPEQCPIDFPIAFGYGKLCCRYDKDKEGRPIDKYSETCLSDNYRLCSRGICVNNGMKQYINISHTRNIGILAECFICETIYVASIFSFPISR